METYNASQATADFWKSQVNATGKDLASKREVYKTAGDAAAAEKTRVGVAQNTLSATTTSKTTLQNWIKDNIIRIGGLVSKTGSALKVTLLTMRYEDAKLTGIATEGEKRAALGEQESVDAEFSSLSVNAAAVHSTNDAQSKELDENVLASFTQRSSAKDLFVNKTREERKEKDALDAMESSETAAKEEGANLDAESKRLEALRRRSTLDTLNFKVESGWKKAAKARDPSRTQALEKSVYSEIIAAWDRDGTPMGPGAMDQWYLDTSDLLYSRGGVDGFLKQEVIARCSTACSAYTEERCSTGAVSQQCTNGQVFRARFARTGTVNAKNDWFICRCNSGVLQFAASEDLTVVREKGTQLKASLKPENIKFDTDLRAEEMLPEHHVKCFRDFEGWLQNKADFSNDLAKLDELALAPPGRSKVVYSTVRDQWQTSCITEAAPGKFVSLSTDGSFDIIRAEV